MGKAKQLRKAERRFDDERDRRYGELAIEREKAIKIKETADLSALELAREIQTYKDEKANELRSQIERERGTYSTKDDLISAVEKMEALIKPLAEFIARQQGRSQGIAGSAGALVATIGAISAVVVIVNVIIYLATKK